MQIRLKARATRQDIPFFTRPVTRSESMAKHPFGTFWIPLLISAAFLLVGFGLPALSIPLSRTIVATCIAVAVLMVILAGVLAYRTQSSGGGGSGGSAKVEGNDSSATGGRGGDNRSGGGGGAGGNASVRGNMSTAKGGDGGGG
jgi:hypothetical protein